MRIPAAIGASLAFSIFALTGCASLGLSDKPLPPPIVVDADAYLTKVGEVTHPPISEMSGIVRSRRYPDVWWVHNDSGDEPRLYAIDGGARILMAPWNREKYAVDSQQSDKAPWPGILLVNSFNYDWEDITLLNGQLVVGEVGNNGNARRDLGFYLVNEPNPIAVEQWIRPIAFIPIAYPDQKDFPPVAPDDWRFDCESIFISDDKLYLLTKYRADQTWNQFTTGTTLYRLDRMRQGKVNTLTLIRRADDLPILPTGADLSPDGRRLAVIGHGSVWLFDKPRWGDDWLSGRATRLMLPMRVMQAEGICWDDANTLRLVNEQRSIFTLDLSALKTEP